jgi:glutamate synthase domain-containing protein 3
MQQQKTNPIEIDTKYQNRIKTEDKVVKINAEGLYYKELNSLLRAVITGDVERIELHNVCGQRYLGTDLDTKIQIDVYGTPGNDLGSFMSGPKMVIHGNAQDASGNTMNDG